MTLEELWRGPFGDSYHDRNGAPSTLRQFFWKDFYSRYPVASVLEVGCGTGGNLRWARAKRVVGCDINLKALEVAKAIKGVEVHIGSALSLPFDDREFELVVTCGLLIHIGSMDLRAVLGELFRVSSKYVLVMEYEAESETIVQYRGQDAALFKRPYGQMLEQYGTAVESKFLDKDMGFDRVTMHLVVKR